MAVPGANCFRADSRSLVRLFVALNVVLAMYNFLSFRPSVSTAPCVVLVSQSQDRPTHDRNQISSLSSTSAVQVPNVVPIAAVAINDPSPSNNNLTLQLSSNSGQNVNETFHLVVRGEFVALTQYVRARHSYGVNATVTLSTQGTIDFLHHVEPLCRRWGGPLSIAVYAPGADFQESLRRVAYLRTCAHSCIADNVTWHFVMEKSDEPKPLLNFTAADAINCSVPFPNVTSVKDKLNKPYPINVARNVARLQARTKYVLASDVELYPSANIIPRFLRMIANEDPRTQATPHVYVLPIFEVPKDTKPPENKTELVALLKANKAVYFHKWICDSCQNFPGREEWYQQLPESDSLGVLKKTKRDRGKSSWEPIYIGTNAEPLYAEGLSWDGKRDKYSQMFEMCLMEYTLLILDNAFLVHAPGIKTISAQDNRRRLPFMRKNNAVYTNVIRDVRKRHPKTQAIC